MSQEITITNKLKTSKNGTNIQYDFSSLQDMGQNNAYQYSASLNGTPAILSTGSFTPQYFAVKNLSTSSVSLSRGGDGFALLKEDDSIVVPHSGSNPYYGKSTTSPSAVVMVVVVGT